MLLISVKRALRLLTVKQRLKYFALIASRIFSSILDVIGVALIGLVTGLAATNIDPNQPLTIAGFTLPLVSQQSLVYLVLLLLVLFLTKSFLAIFFINRMVVFLADIESMKAKEISEHIFSGKLENLRARSKSEILWTTGTSTSNAFSGVLTSFASLISELFLLILIISTFIFVDAIATFFVMIYFGLVVLFVQLAISKSLKRLGTEAAKGNVQSTSALENLTETFREIIVYRKQSYFLRNYGEARTLMAKSTAGVNFYAAMPRYVLETALMLGVVMFVGFQFVTGQLSSGFVVIAVFLSGGVRIMASLLPFQHALSSIKVQTEQAGFCLDILEDFEGKESSTQVDSHELSSHFLGSLDSPTDFSVEFKDVSHIYLGAKKNTIHNLNIKIPSGSHVALIGPSGAGKTTIADLALGLIEPTNGIVKIGNFKPQDLLNSFPGIVSYVPQKPGLISGTILENIAIGVHASEIDHEQAAKALEAAHLLEFVNSLPGGIDSDVGTHSGSLSGGQLQRLGLARALYNKPKLIILDEATSALDASSESIVSESINSLGKEVTVIVIAHRLSTIQNSDIVFALENGEVIASGSFADLRKNVPLVADYVKLMSFDDE